MSWVTEHLDRQKKPSAQPAAAPPQPVPSPSVWQKVAQIVEANVLEFNGARGPQYMVNRNDVLVNVFPKQAPLDSAVVQIERDGIIQVTCPISHPGTPRGGKFKISGDRIVSVGDFVGQPQPTNEPMTPEQFSEFVLKPLLFAA